MSDASKPQIFYVSEHVMPSVEGKFAKLAKRAKRLGVEAPSYEVVGAHVEYETAEIDCAGQRQYRWSKNVDARQRTGAARTVRHLTLVGASVVKLSGWTFVATLDLDLSTCSCGKK